MANHKSAKKRIKQNEKRRVNNKWKTSRLRSAVKTLRTLIADGKKDEAQKSFINIQALIGKLGKTPGMKSGTAARKTSRLASQIAKL